MLKLLFLTHRYLGIGLGIVMVLWCLSGFVMMYKPYPELSARESLSLMAPLDLRACCRVPPETGLAHSRYRGFQLQMLGRLPVLHLTTDDNRLVTVDLRHGRTFHSVQAGLVSELAADFAGRHDYPASRLLGVIDNDQWTVYGGYNPHRPLYHLAADDDRGTQWYMSSRTGEVVQLTSREERVWGYLGAVIHWLYPTLLREKVRLWSQTVIWLTIAGIVLTLTGLYFGLKQYKHRRSGRKSPYRGLSRWHHYAGLLFGLLTFTWVFSGLFSMNPWGLLEGEGMQAEQRLLQGEPVTWQQIAALLPVLPKIQLPADTVRLEGRLLRDRLSLVAVTATDERVRFNADTLTREGLPVSHLHDLTIVLSPAGRPLAAAMMTEEDAFYFNHHDKVRLPAFRVIANDGKATRYYLDPVTGGLLSKVDTDRKWYRWLFYGLHRGDFTGWLRSRPVWDLIMGILLLGVTGVSVTGLCMGLRRLAR